MCLTLSAIRYGTTCTGAAMPRVQRAQQRRVVAGRGADQGEGRRAEIAHRGALAQEFRVGCNRRGPRPAGGRHGVPAAGSPLLRRAGRHGRAHDHGMRPGLAGDRRADAGDDMVDRAQRHAAIRRARRADGDEGQLRAGHRRIHVVPPRAAARSATAWPISASSPGSTTGDWPAIDHRDLLGRDIDGDDLMAERRPGSRLRRRRHSRYRRSKSACFPARPATRVRPARVRAAMQLLRRRRRPRQCDRNRLQVALRVEEVAR